MQTMKCGCFIAKSECCVHMIGMCTAASISACGQRAWSVCIGWQVQCHWSEVLVCAIYATLSCNTARWRVSCSDVVSVLIGMQWLWSTARLFQLHHPQHGRRYVFCSLDLSSPVQPCCCSLPLWSRCSQWICHSWGIILTIYHQNWTEIVYLVYEMSVEPYHLSCA